MSFLHDLATSLTSRKPVELSADDLRSLREANERKRRDERAEQGDTTSKAAAELEARNDRLAQARDELAKDLGATSGRYIAMALSMRRPTGVHLTFPWEVLQRGLEPEHAEIRYARPDLTAVIEARCVLGNAGAIPKVRADDRIFAGADELLRRLPPPAGKGDVDPPSWFSAWLREMNLPSAERVRPDAHTIAPQLEQIARYERDRLYDPASPSRNRALAQRERDLVRAQLDKDLRDHAAQAMSLHDRRRGEVLKVLDQALGRLELGLGWWWLREFRRSVAGEAPRIMVAPREILQAWETCQALGVDISFKRKDP